MFLQERLNNRREMAPHGFKICGTTRKPSDGEKLNGVEILALDVRSDAKDIALGKFNKTTDVVKTITGHEPRSSKIISKNI